LSRLEQRVTAFALPGSDVGRDEVELRFNVLVNRLQLLDNGEVRAFAGRDPELLEIVDELARALHDVEPLIARLDDKGVPRKVLDRLTPLDTRIVTFAAAANRYGGDRVTGDQHELLRLHHLFSALAAGLIVSSGILAALLFLQNRAYRRAHDEVRSLADNLQRTSVSKEYLDDIVDSMSEGLLVATSSGTITKVNAAASRLTGFAESALIGAPISVLIPDLAETLAKRGDIAPADLRRIGEIAESAGGALPVRLSCSTMPLPGDGGANLVCVFQSLAEQRRAEAEREQLREMLYQAQKMQAIGTLAGGIAHDFNNILGSILGHGFLAMEEIAPDHPAFESVEQIMKAGDRAKLLVQQILTYSRNVEFNLEPLDAAEAIGESLALVRSAIPRDVALTRGRWERVWVAADPIQTHQLILNLCVNAGQAIESGRGLISVSVERVAIDAARLARIAAEAAAVSDGARAGADTAGRTKMWFGTPEEGPYCRITVSDNGCGMPQKTIARIFEPFFTTKEVGKGTGLGLAAVHGILRNHKGVISVDSTVGKGTTFEVYIPATAETDDDESVVVAPLPAAAVAGGRERIMLVDDDQSLLEVTRLSLVRLGYEVVAFANPEEALSSFQLMPAVWDLVMTDRAMPRINGEELALEILRIRPEIPIVMATGFGEAVDEIRARDIGIREFLYKPVVGLDLAAAVRRAIDGSEACLQAA
jgi:PAS domain S-box-containing protein